ncbi:ParA family protein [Salmonella enterica subsp. enterica serovar Hadar]|uniref:ParA family protein n=1 Tax=Salmonella hadar TaxID=149385 RepID=A0A5V7L2W9_SALHA|nr:ParA family protein [Salmonella enterica subsp. enterica serovar Hadar]EBZ2897131.1 ParA family protein [Salmonella enterica subsp. enterica serovar Hadar]EDH8373475.1 ParA family protein [Salmonella enterica subsp. enterica serovar Hadar]
MGKKDFTASILDNTMSKIINLCVEDIMASYAFWNNKGGTGKTSLAFQVITRFAELHPEQRILAIDLCPQANLSELLLGGMNNSGSDKLLIRQGLTPRCSIGGYFQLSLPAPYSPPAFSSTDYITHPSGYNSDIPNNIDLICGDPLLELQANAVNTLANQNIPGTNAWIAVIDWLKDLLDQLRDTYDTIFLDCNPSFSFYTQIALANAECIVLPVMADDSSRRAILNAISLVYGLKLPSEIYTAHMFSTKLKDAGRNLPQVHQIVKNRLTQYMGDASAYAAVLDAIKCDVEELLRNHPHLFTFSNVDDGFSSIRDFQTTGVIAHAKGQPFSKVRAGKQSINGHRVQVKADYLENCRDAINSLVAKF